jgi:hypothetical protein
MKKYWAKIAEGFKVYSVIVGIITIIAGGAISVDRFFQKFEDINNRLIKIENKIEISAYYTEDAANAGFSYLSEGQKRIEKDLDNLCGRVIVLERNSNRLFDIVYDLQKLIIRLYEILRDKEISTEAVIPKQDYKIHVEKK